MAIQLVWFKRDLRVHDHAPLSEAAKRGPCICLYIYEPELLAQRETDASHFQFINECLRELARSLRERGAPLHIRTGRLPDVFDEIHADHPFEALWGHQETGNGLTYDRDRRVARWARARGVEWHEFHQTGVVRRLKDRDGWSRIWSERMKISVIVPPRPNHAGTGPLGRSRPFKKGSWARRQQEVGRAARR